MLKKKTTTIENKYNKEKREKNLFFIYYTQIFISFCR